MTRKLSIAIAAGLLLSGHAFADDRDTTGTKDKTQDPTQTQDTDVAGTPDPARDQTGTSQGIGAQVKVLAHDQKTGEGATGIGVQVRELARQHGCESNDSAECKAHAAVHSALADKAGPPTDRPALPGASDRGMTERNAAKGREAEVEAAAARHAERTATGQDTDDMHSNAHRAGHGDGHGMGDGMGGGMGEGNQAAETTRSGDMHGGGGMGPGGSGHMR